jgi:malonyl-CoA/methylmalonyl-CoA synthetase
MSELLERFAARATEEFPQVHDDQGWHSFADIVSNAVVIATTLRERYGVSAGERVAILVHPSADFVAAFYGVLLAGSCVVVLSPLHPPAETRYFCEDARARVVLVSEPMASLASPLSEICALHTLSTKAASRPVSPPHFVQEVDEGSPALQLYTSGTTGKPKGAVLSHGNIATQLRIVAAAWELCELDVLLHALPLHHMHGLVVALLTALGAGAQVRLRAFDAPRIWEEMREATLFMGVPAMYHRLFAAFDAADAPTQEAWTAHARALRLATSGSAALPVTLAERWRALTGTIPLERWGMTEVGVGISNALRGPRFPGCVGLPLPSVEARIVGEGPAFEDADTGELWVRGPSVFSGYHGRPEETAGAFAPDPSGGAPWFRTGDTATRDGTLEGAPYRILGRTSVDILKSGGYKLSALEIEETLREHPAIAEVAVVGIADEAWGDRVVACLVLRAGFRPTGAELRAFCRERLAPYKVPKDWVFVDELPKNALGKVVKPRLVERMLAQCSEPREST